MFTACSDSVQIGKENIRIGGKKRIIASFFCGLVFDAPFLKIAILYIGVEQYSVDVL